MEFGCQFILLPENVVCYWSQSFDENSLIIPDVLEGRTGFIEPFNAEDQFQLSNVDACVNNWISKRFSSENKVLGIPIYHRSFTIEIPRCMNTVDTAEFVKIWTRKRESQQKVLYTVKGNHLFAYNDIESIRINRKYLRRAMFWSL